MLGELGSLRDSIRVTFSKPGYLEITARSASKARALSVVADYHGFALRDFVAIGDGENDLPMLQACGTAVAMGNATEELKQIADLVVATNDRDGVAECVARCFPALPSVETF
jgi:hydroxymethylpyrimidine pyrophosphatase-like HAD family hydrolase